MRPLTAAERRLLLSLVVDPSRLTRDELLDPAIGWAEMGGVAAQHAVSPLVYRSLRALEGDGALPEGARQLREAGRGAYVRNVARNSRMLAEVARVLGPLRGAGIPVILLKGAAVAPTLFGDVGLRAMGDVDLLVPLAARARARGVLESLGYRVDPGVPDHLHAQARRAGLVGAAERALSAERTAELYERYHFHYYLVREDQAFPLELHWDVAVPGRGVQIEDWWAQARAARVGEVDALRLGAEHTLLHFALHLAADGYAHVRLARLMDVHLAVTSEALDAAALRRVAGRDRATRALGVALALAHHVLGTPVPVPLRGLLGGADRVIAARLATRWLAGLVPAPPAREPLDQAIAWTVLRRDRWRSVPPRLYRRFASYPARNPRLPERYRSSELMNLLYAFHPVRVAPVARGLRRLRALARRRAAPAPAVAPPLPVSAADQLALLGLARAAVVQHLAAPAAGARHHDMADMAPPSLSATPPSLLRRTDHVFVSFWVDGRLRGCCGAGRQSLYQNTLSAARQALRDERVEPLGPDDVARLRIEIDVLGAPAPIAARTIDALERDIEPGVHGLVARRGEAQAVFTPSVAIARNWGAEALVRALCEKAGWAPDAYRRRDVRLFRFLASTFIESADGGEARELLRGNVRTGGADWSRERIAAAIDDGAEYLLRAQRPDGGFVYEHDPATGQDPDRDNIVRQLATTWVLASLARRRGGARERAAVRRALGFLAAHVRPATPGSDLLVLADEPDVAELGSLAFALLTLVAAEDVASPDPAEGLAERLADSILSLQRPDGGFHTHVPAATQPAAEDFYPGEAMLALMHLHARRPDPRYPEALRRALPYYRAHFRRHRAAAFVPWQTAAYAHLARLTGERAHASFVFELADAILPLQYAGADVPYPDYVGGYRAGRVPGIAAATYNEGVLEAYDLARRRGEGERAARYQRAALLAALFTLRLQVTRESAFHVRHPERALGAFRFSLADGTLRIDHTEHALNSLLGVERILFPIATCALAGSGDKAHEEGSLASSGRRA